MEKGKSLDKEYCLSVPGKGYKIWRYNELKINYQTINYNVLQNEEKILNGVEARVVAHEVDHLKGISIPQRYKIQIKK